MDDVKVQVDVFEAGRYEQIVNDRQAEYKKRRVIVKKTNRTINVRVKKPAEDQPGTKGREGGQQVASREKRNTLGEA